MKRDLYSKESFAQYVQDVKTLKKEGKLAYPLPCITICRDAGARGELTAHALKQYLDAATKPNPLWQVFEANLVDIILEKKALEGATRETLTEDKYSLFKRIQAFFQGLPSDYDVFEETVNVIQELLSLGNCIIVGRGASYVAKDMPNVLKVKLTVSSETALRRIAKDDGVNRTEAAFIYRKRNKARRNYIKNYYKQNPDNPKNYDLVLDTDNLRVVEIAEIIGKALIKKMKAQYPEYP